MPSGTVIIKGLAERIGEETSFFRIGDYKVEKALPTHKEALELLTDYLLNPTNKILENKDEIMAIGHRVVHGGNTFVQPTLINNEVKDKIKELFSLAPLHNPANLIGIETAEDIFPNAQQIGIFDTAFHQSIPIENHKYAIPNEFYEKDIRKYGFHGISHQYIAKAVAALAGKKAQKIISLHLGNGASATAIVDGQSFDTTMGFGPMNGLIMGTRSGDLDQSVVFFMMDKMAYSSAEVQTILNKKSGMTALAGSNDLRDIEARAEKGNTDAQQALKMYATAIKKYIGQFTAQMNGLDTLVFTAGIGENSDVVRKMVCDELNYLGIQIDPFKNMNPKDYNGDITGKSSAVRIIVIPTNEEQEIANQSFSLINNDI
jgi:acetate kinase